MLVVRPYFGDAVARSERIFLAFCVGFKALKTFWLEKDPLEPKKDRRTSKKTIPTSQTHNKWIEIIYQSMSTTRISLYDLQEIANAW